MRTRSILRLMLAALALVSLSAFASADTWNQKTKITINETIEVPGATLPPGQYIVKLADSQSDRHIVRFMNADGTKVLTTVLAIPSQREKATSGSTFTFYEMPVGSHPALRNWYYPGRLIGQQFVYPKDRAKEIANATGLYVPSMAENSNKYMSDKSENDEYLNAYRGSAVSAVGKNNQSTTYEDSVAKNKAIAQSAPVPAQKNRLEFGESTATVASANNSANAARQDSQLLAQNRNQNRYTASNELPHTASSLPLLLLLATLLVGGGFAIRRFA